MRWKRVKSQTGKLRPDNSIELYIRRRECIRGGFPWASQVAGVIVPLSKKQQDMTEQRNGLCVIPIASRNSQIFHLICETLKYISFYV